MFTILMLFSCSSPSHLDCPISMNFQADLSFNIPLIKALLQSPPFYDQTNSYLAHSVIEASFS